MLRLDFYNLVVGDKVWATGKTKQRGMSGIVTHVRTYSATVMFEDGVERIISSKCLSLTPPPEPTVPISVNSLNDILYHLESFMGLMGFGREYDKIVNLVMVLPLKGRDLSAYPHINRIVNPEE